jgi:hypothetical protein
MLALTLLSSPLRAYGEIADEGADVRWIVLHIIEEMAGQRPLA